MIITYNDMIITYNDNYLMHYQVKGAKHGVRHYQNEDGSLTPLGRIHYGVGQSRDNSSAKGLYRERKYQNADRSFTSEGRVHYKNGESPKSSNRTASQKADDYIKKHKFSDTRDIENASESIHEENFRISRTDEYRSKLASLRNKGDKKLERLIEASQKAENDYLDIAEDDSRIHDDSYHNEQARADLAHKLASRELIKYVMSQKEGRVHKSAIDASLSGDSVKLGSNTSVRYKNGESPKSSNRTASQKADDYIKKNNLENAKAIEATAENIHKENFRTRQTDEYRSKLASLRNKGDKKLERLIEASQKAEDDYLDIAEDDSRIHDNSYHSEYAKADLAHKLASQELIRYVMSQK